MNKDEEMIVEASCGQCMFGMKGRVGCDLAVKFNNVSYFVEGAHIDDYGDAHAGNGFCNCIRKARVRGEIEEDRFRVSFFSLL